MVDGPDDRSLFGASQPVDHRPQPAQRPEQLALVSWLHGGPRPPVTGFRYLELGCGRALSLVALAFYHPDSSFVGIDASLACIEAARAAAAQLGLQNLRLVCADLGRDEVALGDELGGELDYVVARGLYSWMDPPTRQRLLALCGGRLAPRGLCCIDCAVFPGWAMRGLVSGYLGRAAAGAREPGERVERAAAFANWLGNMLPARLEHPFHQLLALELVALTRSSPAEISHGWVGPPATPVYFEEFVAEAQRHGLRFVADPSFNQPEGRAAEAVRGVIRAGGVSGAALEQQADLLTYRCERTSILGRLDAGPAAPLDLAAASELWVASALAYSPGALDLGPGVGVTFCLPEPAAAGREDPEVVLSAPLAKAAFGLLAQRTPAGTPLGRLGEQAETLLRERGVPVAPGPTARQELHELIRGLHRRGLVELRLWEPRLGADPGAGSHALARHESARCSWLTSPWHEPLDLNPFATLVAQALRPGWRRDAVLAELTESVVAGRLTLEVDGAPVTDRESLGPVVAALFERSLAHLGRLGLLAG